MSIKRFHFFVLTLLLVLKTFHPAPVYKMIPMYVLYGAAYITRNCTKVVKVDMTISSGEWRNSATDQLVIHEDLVNIQQDSN